LKTSVFAVDVGYGNTKYAYRAANGAVTTAIFPSLAPLAASRRLSAYGESVFPARKIAKIMVEGIEYEIGPDVPITAAYGNPGRALTDNYASTDNYAALLFGAIHFAGVTHIERLVLGISVYNVGTYSAALKQQFVGEHDFGHGRVMVEKVMVIPQPFGSLVLAASARSGGFPPDDAHLLVDVGYFTTDWVYANGFTVDDHRSGGIPGGASQVCRRIANLISRDEGQQVDDIERIDKALREKTPFSLYGRDIDLAPYLELTAPIIADVATQIRNNVGSLSAVRSIILSGGGAALYRAAIRRAFPRVAIELIDSPCVANVRGFLLAGEAGLARERGAT
jgi:plasmid segregation protein ParM